MTERNSFNTLCWVLLNKLLLLHKNLYYFLHKNLLQVYSIIPQIIWFSESPSHEEHIWKSRLELQLYSLLCGIDWSLYAIQMKTYILFLSLHIHTENAVFIPIFTIIIYPCCIIIFFCKYNPFLRVIKLFFFLPYLFILRICFTCDPCSVISATFPCLCSGDYASVYHPSAIPTLMFTLFGSK